MTSPREDAVKRRWLVCPVAALAFLVSGWIPAEAQDRVADNGGLQFNVGFLRPSGGPVIPFFDGWYDNPDGTYTLVFGYYNVNTEEVLEIPIGPDNFMAPREFDGAQPTHFQPVPVDDHRHRGVFTVTVPIDFGDKDVVWTLRIADQTLSVPGRVTSPPYELEGWEQPGRMTVAPTLRFNPSEPEGRGPAGITVGPLDARVGTPLPLAVWTTRTNPYREEDTRPINVTWVTHQGPGAATFSDRELQVDSEGEGRATTDVTFSEPGDYLLRVLVYNSVRDFEFYCCWTNGFVKVTVTP